MIWKMNKKIKKLKKCPHLEKGKHYRHHRVCLFWCSSLRDFVLIQQKTFTCAKMYSQSRRENHRSCSRSQKEAHIHERAYIQYYFSRRWIMKRHIFLSHSHSLSLSFSLKYVHNDLMDGKMSELRCKCEALTQYVCMCVYATRCLWMQNYC